MLFLTFKALHVIAVICWFAVLFYLPRLFVYHAMTDDEAGRQRFQVMERKLYRGIGNPSMIATILFGAITAHLNWAYYAQAPWFWIKMAMVVFLIGYHHMCGAYLKRFAREESLPGHKFFRVFNEIPVLFLVVVVFLVILKTPS